MSQYRRGADFERRTCRDLEARGYTVVRSPASKSPVDVYAMRPGETVFVQCKLSGHLAPAEWNAFIDFCDGAGALPVMAERVGRKLVYHLLVGRKDGRGGRQPMVPWEPPGKGVCRDGDTVHGDALQGDA